MRPGDVRGLRPLEGRHVSVALDDGTRIDDCELVSAGRTPRGTFWLYTSQGDIFVEATRVLALWESP